MQPNAYSATRHPRTAAQLLCDAVELRSRAHSAWTRTALARLIARLWNRCTPAERLHAFAVSAER